jgi:prepilin-type N-terminal cleavage/methylation domain-containing protein
MKNEQGFSLVELLIVVAIIAIIAAIAVPSLLTSRMAANESSGIEGCRTVGSAQVAFASTNNQMYALFADLVAGNRSGSEVPVICCAGHSKSGQHGSRRRHRHQEIDDRVADWRDSEHQVRAHSKKKRRGQILAFSLFLANLFSCSRGQVPGRELSKVDFLPLEHIQADTA